MSQMKVPGQVPPDLAARLWPHPNAAAAISAFVDRGPFGVAVLDTDLRFLLVSRGLAALDGGDDRAPDVIGLLGAARAALDGRSPLAELNGRLASLQADATDAASELRHVVETWEDDPERLEEVRARRQLLRDLSRKYGEGPAGVLALTPSSMPGTSRFPVAESPESINPGSMQFT